MDGKNWMSRIPPGFHFMPTDEELIYYLMCKLRGQPLPSTMVKAADVYQYHPQELLGANHESYFFTSTNRKYPKGKKRNRNAGIGFWKASYIKDIKGANNLVIGQKRMLVYYINDGTPNGKKTNWLMAEFLIPSSQLPLQDDKLDLWVLCKIYLHNRKKNSNDGGDIFENQTIGLSTHSVAYEDTTVPVEIVGLRQHIDGKKMNREDWMATVPLGFRFIPTDVELLVYYLMPKLMGQPLPCQKVWEADVYKHHPQNLLGTNQENYFFTSRKRKYPNGTRPDRNAGEGFWKASSGNKDIKGLDNSMIGRKRNLVYHTNDGTAKERKTSWLMSEYTIPCSQLPLQDEKLDTWVICKVYSNNREKNTNDGGAISKDQAIESSSHSMVLEVAKRPMEIDGLQQYTTTGVLVQELSDHSNNANEQTCAPYVPLCARRHMFPSMVMPNNIQLQAIDHSTQCGPSYLSEGIFDCQPQLTLHPPPPPLLPGCVNDVPSTSHANLIVSMSTHLPDFSTTLPELFSPTLPDMTEDLESIEHNLFTKNFYSIEAKLKKVLGDSWVEEI